MGWAYFIERRFLLEKREVPIWEKYALTVNEAVEYFNIGEKKIRFLLNEHGDIFSILNGTKVLIKRKKFEEFLDTTNTL